MAEGDLYLASVPVKAGTSGKHRRYDVRKWGVGVVGTIELEIIEGNVVITTKRVDEKEFGPVSTVTA